VAGDPQRQTFEVRPTPHPQLGRVIRGLDRLPRGLHVRRGCAADPPAGVLGAANGDHAVDRVTVARAALLDDVGELVADEPLAALAGRVVLAALEINVGAGGESAGVDRGAELVRAIVGVHAYIAEFLAHGAL